MMAVFLFSNCLNSSRNPLPSVVQPGVLALGKNHRSTFFPDKSDSFNTSPEASIKENLGALVPILSMR
jgi:hypothetical protein